MPDNVATSTSYRRTAAPKTPIAIVQAIPAVIMEARPELVARPAAALCECPDFEVEFAADVNAELRIEGRLALSRAAWAMRIEDAAGQSLSVETETMKEASTDPSEVPAAVTPLPVAVVRA